MSNNNIVHRIVQFPLTRIVVGVMAITIACSIAQLVANLILNALDTCRLWSELITSIASAAASLITYYYLYRIYEKRAITELSVKNFGKNFGIGLLVGFGLLSASILIMYILGYYGIESVNPIYLVIPTLGMAISSGITEEILLRGVLFRIIEEKLGSYIALAITALIFGLIHIWNPNSSLYASLCIAFEAGILLAAAYILTKNLWFPIGIHFMWNFTQGGIWGANVSGINTGSAVNPTISGSELITGGPFGPEAGLQTLVLCVIAAAVMLYLCHKHNRIIKPFWIK